MVITRRFSHTLAGVDPSAEALKWTLETLGLTASVRVTCIHWPHEIEVRIDQPSLSETEWNGL